MKHATLSRVRGQHASRVLRDITPVYSDDEEEEGKTAVGDEAGAESADAGGFIFSDEVENALPADGP